MDITLDTLVDSPRLVAGGLGAWRGTVRDLLASLPPEREGDMLRTLRGSGRLAELPDDAEEETVDLVDVAELLTLDDIRWLLDDPNAAVVLDVVDVLDGRMTGGELQTIREWLGVSTEDLAARLGVRHDTVRHWESGRGRIPVRVRQEVEDLEEHTARAVDDLVAALRDARDPAVVVYRSTDDMPADRPDVAELGARWWRHVVARAALEIPGLVIGTRAELDALDD